MTRTEQVNAVKVREITTWEDSFKIFSEGAEVHGQKKVDRAIKVMSAIDKEFTAIIVDAEGEEVECAHCGFICDCEYYENGGEYPDVVFYED